jgi:hypothetical protein
MPKSDTLATELEENVMRSSGSEPDQRRDCEVAA